MNVGSLFTGIGGFDLGLERAGMRVLWQAESDEFCRRVLARHWPGVPCYPDVRDLVADTSRDAATRIQAAAGTNGQRAWMADQPSGTRRVPVPVPHVDVLCGGFPCQDISVAGRGAGIDGARSGLWAEYARLVGELRPAYVIVENVPALLARGLGRVLGDLAACGYDAEWDCLPASAFGAPHRRDRIWIVAYPGGERLREQSAGLTGGDVAAVAGDDGEAGDAAHPDGDGQPARTVDALAGTGELGLADADGARRAHAERSAGPRAGGRPVAGAGDVGRWARHWESEPDVGRVAHGVPMRVDRLRALGNALVPQIAQWIGERIMSYEAGR